MTRDGREVKMSLAQFGGAGSSVEVDGHDVSYLTRGVTVMSVVGEPTSVVLDLQPSMVRAECSAVVEVDTATRDFLVGLGWTPPPAPGGADAAMVCPNCEWQISDDIPDRRCSLCGTSMVYAEVTARGPGGP